MTDEQVVKAKNFQSLNDVIEDPYFIERVKFHVEQIKKERNQRLILPPSLHYKRTWVDQLYDLGKFTPEFILENIGAIWEKQSLIPASIRQPIETLCANALAETMIYYGKEEA
jgi:hypothetical protein